MRRNCCIVFLFAVIVFQPFHLAFAAGEQLCGAFESTSVAGGVYKIQNNIWGAGTSQCVRTVNETGFLVESSAHNTGTSGPPASYPSIWRGCHWNDCTPNSGMPIQVSGVNSAQFSWQFETIGSGAWNAAAEAWFNKSSEPGEPDGTELMLWLNSNGSVQPSGSIVDTITLAGATWEVWFTNSPGWNFVTYRRQPFIQSASFDLKPFIEDSISRGYLNREWYLMDMEAGFEIWQGGVDLQTKAFSFHVNSTTPVNQPPSAAFTAQPASGKPPLEVSFDATGSDDPEGAPLSYMWDFDDGTKEEGATIQHTFTKAGEYVVTLTVSDGALSDSMKVRVDVRSSDSLAGSGNLLLLIPPVLEEDKKH